MRRMSSILKAKNHFLTMLDSKVFLAGDKLPSEHKMADQLGISRETWRGALELLRREGYIRSQRGIGSFVMNSPARIADDLSLLKSLTEMIKRAGIKESRSSVDLTVVEADSDLADKLNLPLAAEVVVLSRTRFSDKMAISTSINYIPLPYGQSIAEGNIPGSLFKYFEEVHQISIVRATTTLSIPDQQDQFVKKLNRKKVSQIIALHQLHFDGKGNPVMYSLDYLNAECFNFSITRVRQY